MRELWISVNDNVTNEVKTALLNAAKGKYSVALVPKSTVSLARLLGFQTASSADADIQLMQEVDEKKIKRAKSLRKTICVKVVVAHRTDEKKVVHAVDLGSDYVLVETPDWKIIPLENLIAAIHGRSKLLAEVTNANDAKIAAETLELGVDGVVLRTSDTREIVATAEIMASVRTRIDEKKETPQISLQTAKVVVCRELGTGARVCIDTCDIMTHGEGILVGCQSSGLFLVQAEVQENPHVEPRPFRVNAGPVSLYVYVPGNKTKYLSELKAGDEVLIVNKDGTTRITNVGRVKIEKRPMRLIEAEVDGYRIKTIGQNAETIRFVTKSGSVPIGEIKVGDDILAHVQHGGRHFGMLVKEETVIER